MRDKRRIGRGGRADPIQAVLETATANFTLDKDANGFGVLVGLSRAETVELVMLMAEANAGNDSAPERRKALTMRHFAAACARARQASSAVH